MKHFQLYRNKTIYTSLSAAKTALSAISLKIGEPTVALYKDSSTATEIKGIYAISTATGTTKTIFLNSNEVENLIAIGMSNTYVSATTYTNNIVGSLTTLTTTNKANIAGAINSVKYELDNKNVSASGDTYVVATASNNEVIVTTSDRVQEAVSGAETSIQTVTSNNNALTVGDKEGPINSKHISLTINIDKTSDGKSGDMLEITDKGIGISNVWDCGSFS